VDGDKVQASSQTGKK